MSRIKLTLETEIASLRETFWLLDSNDQYEMRDEVGERMGRLLGWYEGRYDETLNTGPYDV